MLLVLVILWKRRKKNAHLVWAPKWPFEGKSAVIAAFPLINELALGLSKWLISYHFTILVRKHTWTRTHFNVLIHSWVNHSHVVMETQGSGCTG